MSPKILLTSFQTWLPHQKSNSSDDLLDLLNISQVQQLESNSWFFWRQLPVDVELASHQVIDAIKVIQPQGIICCGMAESRKHLSVESHASLGEDSIFTQINLAQLVSCLNNTKISHDAGKFVCESLYYQVLKHIQKENLSISCLFVHVPILHSDNLHSIATDFQAIIRFVQSI